MKKECILLSIILVAVIILFSSVIFAQTGEDDTDESNLKDLEGIKNLSGKIDTSKADEILEKDVEIPEKLQFAARILFGIKQGEEIPFRIFIVLVAVWLMFFVVITAILRGLIGKGIKSYIIGFVIACLISLAGVTIRAAKFFFDFGNFFGLLKKYSLLSLIIAVVILIIIMFFVAKLIKKVTAKAMVDAARASGAEVAMGGEVLKGVAKSAEELAKG